MPKTKQIDTFSLYVGSSNRSVFRHCVLDLNNITEKKTCAIIKRIQRAYLKTVLSLAINFVTDKSAEIISVTSTIILMRQCHMSYLKMLQYSITSPLILFFQTFLARIPNSGTPIPNP